MQGVILAAGRGTRLGPLTLDRSKAMLPILGRPMVERVMANLAAAGVSQFILVVSPADQEITGYFQSKTKNSLNIRFALQPEPLGTADALRSAALFIEGDFVLSACDNLLPEDEIRRMFQRWQREPRPAACLALLEMSPERIGRSSAVALAGGRVTQIVEKPAPGQAPSAIASLPLYLFTPAILDLLGAVQLSSRGEYELQDAIRMLIDTGAEVCGVMFSSRQTLTTAGDLLAINLHFLSRLQLGDRAARSLPSPPPGARLIPPAYVEPGARIGPNCALGPYVYLEGGCRVGAGVHLERAVVLRTADIPAGSRLSGQVIA